MFKATKIDIRQDGQVPFFSSRIPYIKELMTTLQISRAETLSQDGLTRTTILTAPSEAVWKQFVDDVIFRQNLLPAHQEYNTLHNITSTATEENVA